MSENTTNWSARLRFDPTAFVAPGAVVVGDVTLGRGASVWFNSVIRGDSAPVRIGENTNIQDLSVVHEDAGLPADLGARVTVGHRALVHGCVIEDDCLIGMGAVVLSGARIGRGSLVGAAALVTEGFQAPPDSLVIGSPARVVGSVREHHRAAIAEGARHYAELAQSYLRRGFSRPHPFVGDDRGHAFAASPPMTHSEWRVRIQALADAPIVAAARIRDVTPDALRRRPEPTRWSALEILAHLRDADRDVYIPRVERLETEHEPAIADVDLTRDERVSSYAALEPGAALEAWTGLRRRLVARLEPAGPREWDRLAFHSLRGPLTLANMVRGWSEHDASHRRQLDRTLADVGAE